MRRMSALLALFASVTGCVSLRPFEEVRGQVAEGRHVRVGDQLVYVEQAGEGETVLLIHGFGASSYSWRKVLPGLAEHFRVVAIDLNGFGYTQRPRNAASYSREGQTALILGVLDALGIDRAHFVGHSYGGALTLWTAAGHPERVRSMVLVDSAAPTYPEDRRSRAASLKPFNNLFIRTLALRPGSVMKALKKSVYDDSIVTPELVQAYLERLRIEGVQDAYYGLTAPRRTTERLDLAKIDIPALVIWGAEDELIRVEEGRAAAARLPKGEFVVMEETGHLPMEEKPEELTALLLAFLRGDGAVRSPSPDGPGSGSPGRG